MCLGNLRTYTETGIAGLNINLFGIGEQFWTPLNKGYAVICSDPKGEPKKPNFLRIPTWMANPTERTESAARLRISIVVVAAVVVVLVVVVVVGVVV